MARDGLAQGVIRGALHHPLRVAEDATMVDVMSGGRLRLGVAPCSGGHVV